ncbi:protein bicaudal C homolog 1-B isoform X4 [Puntigrus tetrazona]|uniref:protein bicaudal C homolog 1-B isoform X4 n=1 Tax=Puntigrus tetrazona TaxID=1606681 RepID=UPI001C8A25E3|nr:protein bicaudal C homolog 1-B isoform X4 [Puntigrus tetrazona]
MAEPLSLTHPDQGSSSERSDDSPSAVSEDDSSGHCGHISQPDPDWTEERFRVDRKKLETMLLVANEGRINRGEDFFQKVMDETNTQIAWPSKLKIGAKSKKDPHIKVSGKREDVREAKEKIMSVLDTKSNRVTLKMDVSHTEHSHVIGKGGNNIKRVMEETGCHIHFPDCNRHSQGEKSNQVSIAGQLTGVEAARVKIRELLPLMLMFECSGLVQHVDCSSPVVQHISHTYNISISFKPPSRLYGNTAIIRGNQNNASGVKRGTALLLEHLAGSLASSVLVSTQLDIALQHHNFFLGCNGANVKNISQLTGAHIHFPELNTHTSPSAVYIQGSIDAVCAARQQLMDCLPLVLLFDIKEEMEVASQVVTTLMEQLDVFISIKPKPKQPSKSVVVKSVERNAGSIYEVRRILLALESSCVPPPINHVAVNEHAPASPPLIGSIGLDTLASAGLSLSTLAGLLRSPVSPIPNGSSNPNCILNGHGSVLNIQNGAVSNSQHIHTPSHAPAHTHSHATGHTASLWASALSSAANTAGFSTDLMLQSVSQSTLGGLLLSGVQSQAHAHTPSPPPGLAPIHKPASAEHLNGHLASSVYSRISSVSLNSAHRDASQEVIGHSQSESISNKSADEGSDTFVEVGMPRSPSHSANGNELKQMLASCAVSSGKRQTAELLQRTKNSLLHVDRVLGDSDCENPVADKRAPGSERAAERRLAPHMQDSHFSVSHSGNQEDLGNDTESDNWGDLNGNVNINGNGLPGNTEFSPAVRSPKRLKNKYLGEQYLSSSNYMDSISMSSSNGCSLSSSLKGTDLPELFSKLGLGKYTDIFQQQEIDLQTFVTLTDSDLKELGITTFGARRKMLLAISELNKSRRKLFDTPNIRSSFLEGGASGRLSSQFHSDMASVSGCW